jgi:ABC-type sugar transport system substrate-binding protein
MGRPVLKLATLYPSDWPSHTGALFDGVRERLDELRDYRVENISREIKSCADGTAYLRAIDEVVKADVKGVIFALGIFSASVRQAIFLALAEKGIPHVALGSAAEVRNRHLYCVWQDCRMCGQLAGELLSLALPRGAETAIFIGEKNHPDHHLKIEGYSKELVARRLRLPVICETLDDPLKAKPAAERLFEQHPNLSGIYIGTENAQGILDFVRENNLSTVKVVATGKSKPVACGLRDGIIQATVYQRQRFQGILAVNILFKLLEESVYPEPEILVHPQLLLRSNFFQVE